LKRILPILSIILFFTLSSNGQAGGLPVQDGPKVLKYYPNPAISYINFDIDDAGEKGLNLHIINFLGKQMYEEKNVTTRTRVDLSQYTRGVYIFQLRDQNGKVIETGKFQIAK